MYARGQVSFEALFLVLIILSSAMYITQLYMQTNDSTIATIIARADLLSQLNSFDERVTLSLVRVIAVDNAGTLEAEVVVRTIPGTFDGASLDVDELEKTKNSIINSTRFENVTFVVNAI